MSGQSSFNSQKKSFVKLNINSFIWDKLGLFLLLFSGIFTTVLLGGFQFVHLPLWWKKTFGSLFKKEVKISGKDAISPFGSLCTSLAASVGVGNIVGVSTAICMGGAGAVLWMWVAAVLGMGTSYAENVLGIYFRRKNINGEWSGGPMYYLSEGLGSKKGCKTLGRLLARLFSLFTVFASFGIGSMGQVNKIVINLTSAFPLVGLNEISVFDKFELYPFILGVFLFVLASVVSLGNIKHISSFTEKIVPFMIMFFLSGSLFVIIKNRGNIIPAFKAVFSSALSFKAGLGGTSGAALAQMVSQGFKRGAFSNEAGLGSTVIVHSSSSLKEPCEQGMWGMFEVFTDTIVICSVTALVVMTSGAYNLSDNSFLGNDATLVATSFNINLPGQNIGGKFVAFCIFMFSFTTIIGWNHYGAKAWEYMFGERSVFLFKILHLASVPLGAVLPSYLAWEISDIFNGLMMIPNLIAVISLSGLVKKISRNYILRKKKGKNIKPMLSYFIK